MNPFAWKVVTLLVALGWASLAGAASAPNGTVWRCGPDGARTYSDAPCAGGRAIDAADPRGAEQVAQGRQVLASDMRRAEGMRQARLEREAQARERAAQAAAAAAIKPAALRRPRVLNPEVKDSRPLPTRSPQAQPRRPKRSGSAAAADDGTWRAVAPASPRAPG